MFVFITSIRHPKNSSFYERVWDLLRDTLFSVCSQTCSDFKVIVVCNRVLDDFSNNPVIHGNVDFVEVDFEPPSMSEGPTTGVPACNLDRGLKFVTGLVAAKKYDPEYVMFFDADDFISRNIVERATAEPGRPGWFFDRGVFYQGSHITYRLSFHKACGTSHILNYEVLTRDIDLDSISVSSDKEEILANVHPFFVKGVLGCHMNYETYFFNCYESLEKWPHSDSAAYNLGTGENHSGKVSNCGPGWFPLRKPSGRLDRHVYDLKFPLINHKRKFIPIFTGDDWCRSALKDLGMYSSAELKAKDVRAIYGASVCNDYRSLTFVRNPWERLVGIYTSGYAVRGRDETFEDFLSTCRVPSQSSQIPSWVSDCIKLEEANNNAELREIVGKDFTISKPQYFEESYEEYYTAELRDLVHERYKDDVMKFDYKFEGDVEDVSVRTKAVPKNLTLCAIILPRIEVFFLEEWIDHHLDLGFEKVILYDNGITPVDNSEWAEGARELGADEQYKWKKKPDIPYFEEFSNEQIYEKLDEIVEKYDGVVEVVPWVYKVDHDIEYPFSQWESLRHSSKNNPDHWFFYVDPDEYLVLRMHDTVQEFIMDNPGVSCFKFEQRVFEQREPFKPVREIFTWGYHSKQPKLLIISDLDNKWMDDNNKPLTVHMAKPKLGKVAKVPSDVAVYHHYRGRPKHHGGAQIRYDAKDSDWTRVDYSMKKYIYEKR